MTLRNATLTQVCRSGDFALLRSRALLVLIAIGLLAGCSTLASKRDGLPALELRIESERVHADLPGLGFAMLRPDQPLYQRGFGMADIERGIAMPAQARLRIASVSKPITAMAMLRLVEQGSLDLDEPVLPLLAARLGPEFRPDPAYARLSARQLLAHCGGWDRDAEFDPMLQSREMALRLGMPSPPPVDAIVAWALTRRPDFAPGSRCVYSNLGYAVLGRLIEALTGQDYEAAVQELLWRPAGITGPRLAATRPQQRGADEPRYHDARRVPSVFVAHQTVPFADGGMALEVMDAHGGWVASAAELVGLLAAVEGWRGGPLLSSESRQSMLTGQGELLARGAQYGLGWEVARIGRHYWHGGDLPGTTALLVREVDGSVWALLANGSVTSATTQDRLRRRIGVAVRRMAADTPLNSEGDR